jgi:hypothetical protein
MRPPLDVAFWNEREKQPGCLTVLTFRNLSLAMLPFDVKDHQELVQMFKQSILMRQGQNHGYPK